LIESLQEDLLRDWVILREEIDNIVGEVTHVFSNKEADMSANDLLIMNHMVPELFSNPLSVCDVC
jgi:hypothetical protein